MARLDTIVCSASTFRSTARRLLRERASNTLLYRDDDRDLTDMLAGMTCVFSDIDGTLAPEGARVLSPRAVQYLGRLRAAGIAVVLVSGKPYEEIAPLVQALPRGLHVSAVYEKGAYRLEADAAGQLRQGYLLGSAELEHEAAQLRRQLVSYWHEMAVTYASKHISFGWAGSGRHRSLLSFDVFAGHVPADYQGLIGRERERLKLKDPVMLTVIENELREFVDSRSSGWNVVHLGNANFEIAHSSVEKDLAILRTSEFQRAQRVLVVGDSGNDRRMFALRQQSKTAAGLVLHNPATVELVEMVDFVTFGTANPYPLFDCLLEAASRSK